MSRYSVEEMRALQRTHSSSPSPGLLPAWLTRSPPQSCASNPHKEPLDLPDEVWHIVLDFLELRDVIAQRCVSHRWLHVLTWCSSASVSVPRGLVDPPTRKQGMKHITTKLVAFLHQFPRLRRLQIGQGFAQAHAGPGRGLLPPHRSTSIEQVAGRLSGSGGCHSNRNPLFGPPPMLPAPEDRARVRSRRQTPGEVDRIQSVWDDALLQELTDQFPELSSITLHDMRGIRCPSVIPSFQPLDVSFVSCADLTFTVPSDSVPDRVREAASSREFVANIHCPEGASPGEGFSILDCGWNIRSLRIENCPNVVWQSVCLSLSHSMPVLQELTIVGLDRVDTCSSMAIFSASLRHLEIRNASAVESLSISCPALVFFCLDGASVRGSSLAALFRDLRESQACQGQEEGMTLCLSNLRELEELRLTRHFSCQYLLLDSLLDLRQVVIAQGGNVQQLLLRRLPSLQKLRVQTMERGTPSSALGAIGSLDQPLQGGLPRLQSLVAEDCPLLLAHELCTFAKECPQLQEFHVIKCPAFALSEMNAELGFYPDSLTSLVLQDCRLPSNCSLFHGLPLLASVNLSRCKGLGIDLVSNSVESLVAVGSQFGCHDKEFWSLPNLQYLNFERTVVAEELLASLLNSCTSSLQVLNVKLTKLSGMMHQSSRPSAGPSPLLSHQKYGMSPFSMARTPEARAFLESGAASATFPPLSADTESFSTSLIFDEDGELVQSSSWKSSLEVDSLASLSKLVHLELAALEVEVAREYPLGSPARAFCPSLAISVRQVEELVLERVYSEETHAPVLTVHCDVETGADYYQALVVCLEKCGPQERVFHWKGDRFHQQQQRRKAQRERQSRPSRGYEWRRADLLQEAQQQRESSDYRPREVVIRGRGGRRGQQPSAMAPGR